MKKQHYFALPIFILIYLVFQIVLESYDNYSENREISILEEKNNAIREQNNREKEKLNYLVTESYKVKKAKESKWIKFENEFSVQITEKNNIFSYKQIKTPEIEKENVTNTIFDEMQIYEKWIYLIQKN